MLMSNSKVQLLGDNGMFGEIAAITTSCLL